MSPHDTYIHGHGAAVMANHARRTAEECCAHLLPRLRPGMRLLDVGCGPGTITAGLAARVDPGEVIGLDREPSTLPGFGVDEDSWRAEHHATELAGLTFAIGDVYGLPFGDGEFDVVHAHQLLHHLSDPVAAIREMARVTKRGGIISLREADYGAMTWYPAIPRLSEFFEVFRAQGRENGTDLDAGRQVYAWARAAGLAAIEPSASAWCFATEEQREFWSGTWAERVISSAFGEQAIESGLIEGDLDLERFATAWREWGSCADAWFAVLHGEVLATPARA